jgi:ribokinase
MGETLIGHSFHMGCGGKGSNQAAMAAKLGAEVTIVTKLGHDPLGDITFKNYQDLGINTRHVHWDSRNFSGVAPIFVDDEGNNSIVIVPGANLALTSAEVDEAHEPIKSADVVICQFEIPIECTNEAFKIAKDAGVLTMLNPAPAMPIPNELYQLCDIAVLNEIEAETITGMTVKDPEDAKAAAAALRARGPRAVIVTLGERGVLLVDEEGPYHVQARRVRVVDTTGAGDAFVGSLACFLGEGQAFRPAVANANLVASITVTRVGTQSSFPSRTEVQHLLR